MPCFYSNWKQRRVDEVRSQSSFGCRLPADSGAAIFGWEPTTSLQTVNQVCN